MGEKQDPPIGTDGVHAGDFAISIVPAFGTDGHLDLPESRERAERAVDEAEAAKRAGDVAPSHPLPDPAHPAPTPVLPVGEGGDVDASIDAARAAAAGDSKDDPDVPILLRDPLTGKVVGSV